MGKMVSRVRCARCNKNPRSLPDHMRPGWKTVSMEAYDPKIVNAKANLEEHKNEQQKINFANVRRGSLVGAPNIPRRRKSVFVSVSLEDSSDEETKEEGVETLVESEVVEAAVPLPTKPKKRQSVWDRLTNSKQVPVRFNLRPGDSQGMPTTQEKLTSDIPRNLWYPSIPDT